MQLGEVGEEDGDPCLYSDSSAPYEYDAAAATVNRGFYEMLKCKGRLYCDPFFPGVRGSTGLRAAKLFFLCERGPFLIPLPSDSWTLILSIHVP